MKILKITIPIAMSLVFLGCASKNYEEAVNKDTVYAYKNFLKEYGDSDYAYKAKRKLRTLQAYIRAKRKNILPQKSRQFKKKSNSLPNLLSYALI